MTKRLESIDLNPTLAFSFIPFIDLDSDKCLFHNASGTQLDFNHIKKNSMAIRIRPAIQFLRVINSL